MRGSRRLVYAASALIVLAGALALVRWQVRVRRSEPDLVPVAWRAVDQLDLAELREEALDSARRLVRAFPDSPHAWLVTAKLQSRLGATADSMNTCRRCLDIDPQFWAAYHQMASIAIGRGEYGEAENYYRKLVAGDPSSEEALTLLAETLIHGGKLDEAIALLESSQAHGLAETARQMLLGQAYLELQKYEQAKECFTSVLAAAPKYPDAWYALGNACTRLGDADQAKYCREQFDRFKTASKSAYTDPGGVRRDLDSMRALVATVHQSAGREHLRQGDTAEAERYWRRAAELSPDDQDVRRALALFYRAAERWPEAFQMVAELRRIAPDQARHAILAGSIHAQAGQFDEAAEAYREATRMAPTSSAGFAALAHLYLLFDRSPTEAADLARQAVACEPTPPNYFLLAQTLIRLKDPTGARAAIEQAIRGDPHNQQYQSVYQSILAGLR